jgi:uncharacterized membrane protein
MKVFGRTLALQQILPWILIVGGIVGILSSAIITYDEIQLAKDPNFSPACNIDPVIGCGSITKSDQAHVFGFPNQFIGLAGYAVIVTTGVVLLAGAKLKRWYWLGLQLGLTLGILFIHWLITQSLYILGSLCPYCMAVWVATITMFWYVTLYNIQAGHIRLRGRLQKIAFFARRHHLDILVLWFLIIFALILKRFWYYYGDKIL